MLNARENRIKFFFIVRKEIYAVEPTDKIILEIDPGLDT